VAAQSPVRLSFSRDQVCRALGISARQLRSWERLRLVPSSEEFAPADVATLRNLVRLRENRVPVWRLRHALTALRKRFPLSEFPLREMKLIPSRPRRFVVLIDGQQVEPATGQCLLDFEGDRSQAPVVLAGRTQPDNTAARNRQEADRLFQKALDLEAAALPIKEIVPVYLRALELDPALAAAHLNLGTLYFQIRAFDRAEKYYLAAVAADPRYALAHFNIGNLYDEMGDRDKALRHYAEAVQLDPGYPDVHYNLALLHQATGQSLRALYHWKAYLRLDPDSNWAQIARRQMTELRRSSVLTGSRGMKQRADGES
jgi:tetratricopeptide (TPR) repeat protein